MKKKDPIDADVLGAAVRRFSRQADRGTALIAAAWLDDAMEEALRRVFLPHRRQQDLLLAPDHPLGSLAAKTRLAFLLGLLEETARNDLDAIREIRNKFAHARHELRFTNPDVRKRCRGLHAVRALGLGLGRPLRSPREMFVLTTYFLVLYLIQFPPVVWQPAKTVGTKTDIYGVTIRRYAKHKTIEALVSVSEEARRPGGSSGQRP